MCGREVVGVRFWTGFKGSADNWAGLKTFRRRKWNYELDGSTGFSEDR
jgi:hypothetical protein